ncbi:hypothetical protein GOP47_0016973 [Adiantum capillus-veneris]|uniref:Uncharacterized protein n=1 Tax=Adiantum capillus-veneris TaxID=13818 RepID=A0A9D4UJL7_ADICA|nr:hypothetical protein GOP47_0016973 [Adiantum capillus-veneris]
MAGNGSSRRKSADGTSGKRGKRGRPLRSLKSPNDSLRKFRLSLEGNHRTVAWIAAIREKFSTCKEKHCRVLCTIIDPTKVPEIALLSSLQRMNFCLPLAR